MSRLSVKFILFSVYCNNCVLFTKNIFTLNFDFMEYKH